MQRNEIIRAYGKDYAAITKAVLDSADLAGEIGNRKASILIKPNVLAPTPAEFGATTHPEVVRALIEYLSENGFNNITIAEGSWVGDLTTESFEMCGFYKIEKDYGIKLVDTQKDKRGVVVYRPHY